MRGVPNDDYDTPDEDEQFQDEDIISLVSSYMQVHREEVTATVSAEWDRKNEKVRGPLNDTHSYRYNPQQDDLVLSLEIRVDGWQRSGVEAIEQLQARVHEKIAARDADRHAARVAELTAAVAAKLAEAEALGQELAELEKPKA